MYTDNFFSHYVASYVFLSVLGSLKALSHSLHLWGLSPVCVLICKYRAIFFCECFVTFIALVWPLPSVYSFMSFKCSLFSKRLVTLAALIRLLSSMYPHMFYKIARAPRQSVTWQNYILHCLPYSANTNRSIEAILWPPWSWYYQLHNGHKMNSVTLLVFSAWSPRHAMKPQIASSRILDFMLQIII